MMSAMSVSCEKVTVTGKHDPVITNGHEFVDLGLSVKWATCNVGASKPEDSGAYYQWAGLKDVSDKSIYLDYSNCPYHTGSAESTGWTKYVPSKKSSYWSGVGYPDNKDVLYPSDDVARQEWGGSWRMPTIEEWDQLRNSKNCSWTWMTIGDINGFKVQSKKEGYTDNWIFLPAAGHRGPDGIYDVGSYGYYWSSSLFDDPCWARSLSFNMIYPSRIYVRRYYGLPVRPVLK